MKRILAASLLAAAPAFAGVYDQPYSIITIDRNKSSDPDVIPVIVNRVDEVSTLTTDNRAVVAPGRHKVTLDVPPRKGFHQATQNVIEVETKPCVRYNMAARLENRTGQQWAPIVRSEEPIGECRTKFKLAEAK